MKTNREVLIGAGLLLASAIIITTHTTDALSSFKSDTDVNLIRKQDSIDDQKINLVKYDSIDDESVKIDLGKDSSRDTILGNTGLSTESTLKDDEVADSTTAKSCDVNRDEKVDIADFVTILNCMAADSNSESCDLNGDEKVDIADTVTMLNCMAEGDSSSDDTKKCDVNKDKKVDIADYVTMLNIMATDDYITGGDLNDDGKIDIADIVTILNCMADGDSSSESSDEEINKCDINGDKKVDIADYVTILNCMAADSSSERCDVNEDGKVDIADHVSVLNCMAVGKEIDKCDVNADGKVDTGDFQTVLNIMAANSYTKTADLNGDKKIDIADGVSVLNCIAAENAKNVANGLVNKLTKTVEFNANKTETKVIFSGTYKASKTVSIEGITITNNNAKGSDTCYNDFIIHVFIDGEDIEKNTVINSCTKTTSMKFKEKIDLKKGEYIEIKIKGELNSAQFRHSDKKGTYSATLTLYGDNLPNTYGTSLYTENSTSADFAPIKIVSDGSEDSEKSNPKEPSEILQNGYSRELNDAYDFARSNKITTMNSIEDADMNGTLNRAAMAKMLSNYAINSLGLEPDTTKDCYFSDVSSNLDRQYDNGITKACQLGLMGVGIDQFYPYGRVTRAEFGTVLSRALNANNISKLAKMNDASPYYYDHLKYLNEKGIMNNISNPSNFELRGRVMLMLNRSAE